MSPRLLLVAIALCSAACGPKVVRETVFENARVKVELRQTLEDGQPVQRGYAHPAHIADVRIAHILASLSHRTEEDDTREPTIRSLHVYDLAEGMAKAFGQATADQEIVGQAISRDRRLAIFVDERVTAFRSYLEGDRLIIEFFEIERLLERDTDKGGSNAYEIPLKLPRAEPDFRVVPADAQFPRGARGVAVAWRDEFFRKPVSLRFRQGQVSRRTVLMEAPVEPLDAPEPAPAPESLDLTDAQLQALDQLDAARRAGYLTEDEYQRRRSLILKGKLSEAGYGGASR